MSINAEIIGTTILDDGSVALELAPWDETPAGQPRLIIVNPPDPPEQMAVMTGCHIWGGADAVYIGSTKFADRIGCVELRLVAIQRELSLA